MLRSAPAAIFSTNCVVPDLATVPRFSIRSCLVIPIPLSVMVSVPASSSNFTRMSRSSAESSPRIYRE